MQGKDGDRRTRRTRQLLRDALIALMLEKRYDKITVQDIIDRADVGRSTFYAHYRDKEDLHQSSFAEMLEALTHHLRESDTGSHRLVPSLELFRHVQQQHHLYKALVPGRGVELLFKTGHDYISRIIERRLAAHLPEQQTPTVPLPVVANYVAGALVTLLKWWLDHQMSYSPERMDEIFQQLVMPGVWATLGIAPPRPGPVSAF
jgi:AcrR family transcriptional regulator